MAPFFVVAESYDADVVFLSPVFDCMLPFGVAVDMRLGFAHSKVAIDGT